MKTTNGRQEVKQSNIDEMRSETEIEVYRKRDIETQKCTNKTIFLRSE